MKKRIFTGNYGECKIGNLISISGDRGKSVGFTGKSIPQLAPKRKFWEIWHNNIGKIPEEQNNRYYIEEYYKQVLSQIDIEEVLKDEKDPILLCYEKEGQFCHRHVLAEFVNLKYGIYVPDISISEGLEIIEHKKPEYIRQILRKLMEKEVER